MARIIILCFFFKAFFQHRDYYTISFKKPQFSLMIHLMISIAADFSALFVQLDNEL